MSRMVRKQVYIREDQERLLKERARELGVTEAEVIRSCLEKGLGATTSAAVRKAAWERLKESIDARAKLQVPEGPRTWTREELYDRPKYLSS